MRTFLSSNPSKAEPNYNLPIDRPMAVYYRQSTDGQIGNTSTAMQQIDLVADMVKRGWKPEDVYLIDMDGGISGTTKIDERAGMKHLFQLITERKIGVVACVDEDRLFRDVTQIQVNIFIEACKAARVQVLTPTVCYVFHHPTQGDFYRRQFRFKSEMAAEYLNFLQSRLYSAKERIQREGKWVGSSMPMGYMVDMRKDAPTYRKFVPFEPFAEYIRQVFKLFVSTGGSKGRTQRLIRDSGLRYPIDEPPEGFKIKYLNITGNFSAATTIMQTVTNPIYLGHWMYKGSIIIWDNHEPIVPAELFYSAFNLASKVDLTGAPNPNYACLVSRNRPSREASRPLERPLFEGLMWIRINDDWKLLGCSWNNTTKHYHYYYARSDWGDEHAWWARKSDPFDEAILYHLRDKMDGHQNDEAWKQALGRVGGDEEAEKKRIRAQIKALQASMKDVEDNLVQLSHPTLITRLEDKYAQMEAEHNRLLSQLKTTRSTPIRSVAEFEHHYKLTTEDWDKLTRDERRRVIAVYIKRIEIPKYEVARSTSLRIIWYDHSETWFDLERTGNGKSNWSYADKMTLFKLSQAGASREEMLKALPHKDWQGIRRMIAQLDPSAPIPHKAHDT